MALTVRRKPLPIHATVRDKSEDLWQAALDSLADKFPSIATINPQQHKRAILETVLYEAHEKRKQCLVKRWKITKRNGDIIVLRDVFEKIIQWVDKFQAVGDAAIKSAPTYAAIPWSVVSILIKASISDNEMFAAMIEGVEKVTNIIARYAIFEDIYFRQQTSASDHLRSSLITLYASVLMFLVKSNQYFGKNTAKRILKSFGQSASEIDKAYEEVERKQIEVDRTAQLVGMEILQNTSTGVGSLTSTTGTMALQLEYVSSHITGLQKDETAVEDIVNMQEALASIMGPTQRLLENLHRYDDFLEIASRKDIFDWLSPVRYQVHHLTERQDRLLESGKWMLQRDEFRSWQDSSISGTLWLHGMPGCGKSKLASAVVDDLLERRGGSDSSDIELAPVAYFYCSRNKAEPERSDPQEVLRCIARQLCGDDPNRIVNESLRHIYQKMEKPRPGGNKLSLNYTVDLILSVLKENPGTIIIDALDECDPVERYSLFESLDRIVEHSSNVVKVFLTSRNDGDIVCRLNNTPNIYIDAQKNKLDIQRFITGEVERAVVQRRMLNGNVSKELQLRIRLTLDQGANGMFRWVSLQIQNLCDRRRMKIEEDILDELTHLPKSLPDLYLIAYDQIAELGQSSYRLALFSLQLLMVAVRPVYWDEFLYLISCSKTILRRQPSKAEILDITANFLADDQVENRPKFIHLSAKEYLESRQEFLLEISNMTAAVACLDSLSVELNSITENYTYSTFYLGNHLSTTTPTQRLQFHERIKQFLVTNEDAAQLETSESVSPSSMNMGNPVLQDPFDIWRKRVSCLYDKGLLGTDMVDSAELCQASLLSGTPILAVCAMGLEDMLLALPTFDVNKKAPIFFDNLSWTGSLAMSQYKDRGCMELAVIFNRPQVLRQLFALGYKLDVQTHEQETLLHLAAKLGQAESVDALLLCGVDPNILTGYEGASPDQNLSHAAQGWNYVDLRDEEAFDGRPQTAMGFRTYYGGKSAVFSPFYAKQEAKAAIHLAAERESGVATLETLISHRVDVNIRTSNNHTTLQLALEAGKSTNRILSILLQAGADPNAILESCQTILHLMAAMGLDEAVKILLASGGDPSIADAHGQTPGQLAARYGHKGTAELLGFIAVCREPSGYGLLAPHFGNDRRSKSAEYAPAFRRFPSSDNPEMKEKVRFLGLVKREWSKLQRDSLS